MPAHQSFQSSQRSAGVLSDGRIIGLIAHFLHVLDGRGNGRAPRPGRAFEFPLPGGGRAGYRGLPRIMLWRTNEDERKNLAHHYRAARKGRLEPQGRIDRSIVVVPLGLDLRPIAVDPVLTDQSASGYYLNLSVLRIIPRLLEEFRSALPPGWGEELSCGD